MLVLFITVPWCAFAGNELKVMRTSLNTIDIQFSNSDEITGMQFCIRASRDIILESIQPGNRIVESSWMMDSYSVNDSTMNVVVLNMRQQSLSQGSGTLASLAFSLVHPDELKYVEVKNVMVINARGDSLGVTISNLRWNDNYFSETTTSESRSFIFGQNYPNPFNPSTILAYHLNAADQICLSIYDIRGREVRRLVDQYQYAGDYHVVWDSRLGGGTSLASGLYIARLSVGHTSVSRKIVLTK